jgi:hypothetical protein
MRPGVLAWPLRGGEWLQVECAGRAWPEAERHAWFHISETGAKLGALPLTLSKWGQTLLQ